MGAELIPESPSYATASERAVGSASITAAS